MTLDEEDVKAIAAEVVRRLDLRAIARELHRMTHEMSEAQLDAVRLADLPFEERKRRGHEGIMQARAECRDRMKVDPEYRKQIIKYQQDQERQSEERRSQREAYKQNAAAVAKAHQVKGLSLKEIAAQLNSDEIVTTRGNFGCWTPTTVRNLLDSSRR